MGGSILSETNRVMSGDPNDSDLGKGSKTNSASGIGNEVQECSTIGNDGPICGETIHNSTHGMLTNAISDVTA